MRDLVTREPAVRRLVEMAERAARSQAAVLLTGESGTGKTRVAGFIHARSPRAERPFVEVSCAGLPAESIESELFGRFEQAQGGTIYLDEIQELEPGLQAKILRAIEDKRFERPGGARTLTVDVRILVSTRQQPEHFVEDGRLREDLYYRVNVVRLHLPPLRDRPQDIDLLAEHFLRLAAARQGLPSRRLARDVLDQFRRYDWPGNVRELGQVVEAAAVLATDDEIRASDLPAGFSMASPSMLRRAAARGLPLNEVESAYIDEVLRRTRGNKSEAARILGIHRKTLHEKLRARAARR